MRLYWSQVSLARRLWVIAVFLSVGGCATGPDYPPIEDKLKPEFVGSAPVPAVGKQIVVVRFPFGFNEADGAELRRRFNEGSYYGVPRYKGGRDPDEKTFDAAVAKTSYYAFRLQEALQVRIPEATVVLQPVNMQMKDGSTVIYGGDFESVAPTVVIDFFAYVWPQWRPDIVQPFATMGRTLVPIVSVRTLPQVSSTTSGAVAGMRFLTGVTTSGTGAGAYEGAGAGILELLNCAVEDAFVQTSAVLADTTHINTRPWRPDSFLAWPTLKVTIDSETIDTAPNELSTQQAVDAIGHLVRDVLVAAEANAEAQRSLAAFYALNYDPEAAAAIREGRELDAHQAKLLKSFAGVEQKFLEKQTQALHGRLATGDWAASFKDSRAKEQSSLTKAKVVGWVGILAAGAIGNPGVTMALSQTLDSSYTNWASSMSTAMADVRAEQLNVAFEELGSETEISASSLVELRGKLRELYVRRTNAASTPNSAADSAGSSASN